MNLFLLINITLNYYILFKFLYVLLMLRIYKFMF